jgi:hypothetical protein
MVYGLDGELVAEYTIRNSKIRISKFEKKGVVVEERGFLG